MFLKGETPVIYFYTKEKQNVAGRRGVPAGSLDAVVSPGRRGAARPSDPGRAVRRAQEAGGSAGTPKSFPHGRCLSQISKRAGAVPEMINMLPETSSDALWNHARDVDAAFVKTIDGARSQPAEEFEKFLFYRGLGEARLPLHIEETGQRNPDAGF